MPPVTITTLTPNAVQQSLQSNGLAALGLTTFSLSPRWGDTTPIAGDYDNNTLTLTITGLMRAPFLALRRSPPHFRQH
jgi:hypothetical protein